MPVTGEGKRRRGRLREGKRGGGQAESGLIQRRWPEKHGGTWRGGAGQRRRRSGVQRKERPLVGRCWAERLLWLGPTLGNSKENRDRPSSPPGRIEGMNRKGP
jgi:hypothetical protein